MSLLLDALNKAQRQSENVIESATNKTDTVDLSDVHDLDIDTYTVARKPIKSADTDQSPTLQLDERIVESKNNTEDTHKSINFDDIALTDDISTLNDTITNLDSLSLELDTPSFDSHDSKVEPRVDQLDIDSEPAALSSPPAHQAIHDGVLADLEADLQRIQSPIENNVRPQVTPTTTPSTPATVTQTAPAAPTTSIKPAPNTSRASARRFFNASSKRTPNGRKVIYAFAALTTISMLAGAAYVYSITQEFQTPVSRPPVAAVNLDPPVQQTSPNTDPVVESVTPGPVQSTQPHVVATPGPTLSPQIDQADLNNLNSAPTMTSIMPESAPSNPTNNKSFDETDSTFEEESLPDFDAVAEPQRPSSPAPAETHEVQSDESSVPIIRVTRSTSPAQVSDYVAQAYTAFQYGELQTAFNQYQNALREEPNNRDAMLGLAAIAAHQNNLPLARSYYSKLLQFNGNDAMAIAGLQGVAPTTDTGSSESELKSLIAKTPDAPYLHFALGNIYIQQQRWPDAERAFFEAYRQDKNRPDFAFNLAICLDHLGQVSPALHYYETALSLAMTQTAGFDVEQAKQRISDLRRIIGVPSP